MAPMRVLLVCMWLAHWLPLPILGRLGEGLGSMLFGMLKSRRHIALTNLRLCFPDLSEAARHALARRHFQAYARSMLERGILWWSSEQRLRRLIVIEPGLPLEAIRAGPVIFLCPHFVSLDVAGVAIALDCSACSMYSRQANADFDQVLRRARSRFKPVKIFPRSAGVKPILRAMREGLPFFMLPDMDFGPKDAEFTAFFGVPAATLTAPARIAALTQAKPQIRERLDPEIVEVSAIFQPCPDGYQPACSRKPAQPSSSCLPVTVGRRPIRTAFETELLRA